MASTPRLSHGAVPPPSAAPYRPTPDRWQRREPPPAEKVTQRASAVLEGLGDAKDIDSEVAFAHAPMGLLAGHTHYFEGFAVLMPLAHGSAVAVRESPASHSRLVFEGSESVWSFDRTTDASPEELQSWPPWARVVAGIVRRIAVGQGQTDVGVSFTIPSGCAEAYLSSLGVAATRALQALYAVPERTESLLPAVQGCIVDCLDAPFSIAYLVAADAGRPTEFLLVDTASREHLALAAPSNDVLGWGLVDADLPWANEVAAPWKRVERAAEAVGILRKHSFPSLTSLRELEHRDLQRGLQELPHALRPIVRHLVTDNRRVQRLAAAIRRSDWQLFGALLLMSHASLRDDWAGVPKEADLVVEQVEAMSLEGMYGACVSGRGACVLVLGLPFVLPQCLERIEASFVERFGRTPATHIL